MESYWCTSLFVLFGLSYILLRVLILFTSVNALAKMFIVLSKESSFFLIDLDETSFFVTEESIIEVQISYVTLIN